MKLKIISILLIILTLSNCQKREVIPPEELEQEVSFSAILVQPDLKNSEDFLECKEEVATHAHILLTNDEFFDLEVYFIGTSMYTKAMKMVPGTYYIEEFFLFADDGDGIYDADDIVVYVTPEENSTYEVYLDPGHTLPYEFTVTAFNKVEIDMEVLCFVDLLYQNFGFYWFNITEIVIREQCFFGDICIDPEDYVGSPYEDQVNGLQIDVPAIFYVEVWLDTDGVPGDSVQVPYSPFGNIGWAGEGQPLCVQYPDNLSIEGEIITMNLYVLINTAPGEFQYVLYYTWTLEDEEMIPAGEDGIVEFVIGDCNYNPPDVTIDPNVYNPPVEPTCETAFAYGNSYATCFLDIPDLKNNRWGWTNGPLAGGGTYTFPIYAGAGQCILENGTNVGNLTVQYLGTNVTVTYDIPDPDLSIYSIHIYAGNDILPMKNGNWTVAPGQYPWIEDIPEGTNSYSHTFTGMSGHVYVVAHAAVCGIYD